MKKQIILIVIILAMMITGCVKTLNEYEPTTNYEVLKYKIDVVDIGILNTLVTQEIDSTSFKSKVTRYPKHDNFYYILFEDLYPHLGDYDFNDIVIKSEMFVGNGTKSPHDKQINGSINIELINKGGSIPVDVGMMFYYVKGKKYTRIPNDKIKINGVQLESGSPFFVWKDVKSPSDSTITFEFEKNDKFWISYFIKTDNGEIMTSGFAPSTVLNEFTVPTDDFVNVDGFPWGLEIEAKTFGILNEKVLFLKGYPEFEEWVDSNGVHNKKWFETPDTNFTHF